MTKLREIEIDYGLTEILLENDLLELVLLPFKGGDIYCLVYKPAGVDLLLKTPRGINAPDQGVQTSLDSEAIWMDNYPGGWQLLFPNGGDVCFYKELELNFHGEASVAPWRYELRQRGGETVLRLETDLCKSPFRIERTLLPSPGTARFAIQETIRNGSPESEWPFARAKNLVDVIDLSVLPPRNEVRDIL